MLAASSPSHRRAEAASGFEPPSREIGVLLKVTLQDEEARRWLLAQPWEEVLHQITGGELLGRVLIADFSVTDSTALSAFLGTLPPAEEAYLTGLAMDRPFPQPLAVARGYWAGVEGKILTERRTALEVRQNLPGQSAEEIMRLQKEVLDLHGRLKEIARL